MLNIAVIGGGYIAQNHIEAIKKIEIANLAAVIDVNSDVGTSVAKKYGCRYFSNLQEADAAVPIDVVELCVPTFLHEKLCLEAAKAKHHVFCEKPVTFTLDSFDRMLAACRENGVHFMVGQVVRWWPEYIRFRKEITDGTIGDLRMIYEKRLCQHPQWSKWHTDPAKSGGGLYDLNIHDIDYLYSLFGKPKTVYATGWKSETGCWNHVITSLTWSDNIKAVVETSMSMTGNWPFSLELRATGSAGTLSYQLDAGVNINDGEQKSRMNWYPAGSDAIYPVAVQQDDMFEMELREFYESILEDREPAVRYEENRGVLEVILATKTSLEENRVVVL